MHPATGIKIALVGPSLSQPDVLDPGQLPEAFVASIRKIYASCAGKFASYAEARRILLLDPHGDLRTEDVDWWNAVLACRPPPAEIGEIWSGTLDWITEQIEGWIFERLHSSPIIHTVPSAAGTSGHRE